MGGWQVSKSKRKTVIEPQDIYIRKNYIVTLKEKCPSEVEIKIQPKKM